MARNYIFGKVTELKEKFKNLLSDTKKVKALENYKEAHPQFKHKKCLLMVTQCVEEGFLDSQTADFLTHMINKYGVDYLNWFHKTNWLKREMARLKEENEEKAKPAIKQLTFFDKPYIQTIPFEAFLQKHKTGSSRRI